ncbi:polyhomeotic protein 1 isoform X6 [Tropilaelaps mercedesae]|uniref:Polyhomeotic protein 1 isoform X6 n=1 Tax=Tropilaelaps mercedesae TaxID=418985 RepID=A0A1V9XZR4_9ACAR|nr:polyhomeotic protein 1 isoform X6 [Tropilaelaps mercedesae]
MKTVRESVKVSTDAVTESQTAQAPPEFAITDATSSAASKPATVEKPGEPKLPSNWSVQEVYDFIKSVPGCAAYADEFRSQDIDGEALIFLKSEHMSLMNVTIGAAARICARLNQLCGDRRKT